MYPKRARVRDVWLDYSSASRASRSAIPPPPTQQEDDLGQPTSVPVVLPPPVDPEVAEWRAADPAVLGEIIETDQPFVFSNNLLRGVGSSKFAAGYPGIDPPYRRYTNGTELIEHRLLAGAVTPTNRFLDYTFAAPRVVNEVRAFFSLPALSNHTGSQAHFTLPPYHAVDNPTGDFFPTSRGRWRFFNADGVLVHEIAESLQTRLKSFVRVHRFADLSDVVRIQYHPISYQVGLCELEVYPVLGGTAGIVPVEQPVPTPRWTPLGTPSETPMALVSNLLTGATADHINPVTQLEFPDGLIDDPMKMLDLSNDTFFVTSGTPKRVTITVPMPITVTKITVTLRHVVTKQSAQFDALFKFFNESRILISELTAAGKPIIANVGQTADEYQQFEFEDEGLGPLVLGAKYIVLIPTGDSQSLRWITDINMT